MNAMEPTDLVVMNALTAETVFAPGGVEAILEKIASAARAVPADISTPSGRAAIKSTAYKVARSKTTLDDMGKDLAAEWKRKSSAIDAERRTIRDRLEALQDEVRKPLTDWENAEKDRVAGHEDQIALIEQSAVLPDEPPVVEIVRRLQSITELSARDWQEFGQRASVVTAGVVATLTRARDSAIKRDADRADLDRLRREQAERERREREERIAAEAAEKARLEAEARAKAEAQAAERRASEEQDRVEREKAQAEQVARDAEERARRAEAERVAAEERSCTQAEEAARRAEAARVAAAEQAERDRVAAVEAERQRVAAEKATQEREAARREADKQHRASINRAACEALVTGGLAADAAKLAITLIAQKAVPNVTISY